MKREDYRERMDIFVSSNQFIHRKIEKENSVYLDKNSRVIYAIEVNTLKEITEIFSNLRNPVIFLSKSKRVLNKITEVFNSDNWDEERIENLSGEEFDYIYLRQCNLLGLDKGLPFKK